MPTGGHGQRRDPKHYQSHTVKVVEGKDGVKVHTKDLSDLVHESCLVDGEDRHVVSGFIAETRRMTGIQSWAPTLRRSQGEGHTRVLQVILECGVTESWSL